MGNLNDLGFPFTSIGGDRQYSAADWRDYFGTLFSNGVVQGAVNGLEVKPQASPNKTVYVDTGVAVINGAMRIADTTTNLTIADNTSGNPRIDRIVARLNYTDRKIEFALRQGTPASSPVAPTLTRTASAWEISLAKIAVANGFSTITATEITDERTDEAVCGYCKTSYMQEFDDENNLLKYDRNVTSVDTYDRPTEVQYTRPADDSLFLKIVYSNPNTAGQYQTITETYYEANGTTVYKTITYTATYLASGIIDTMTRVVS